MGLGLVAATYLGIDSAISNQEAATTSCKPKSTDLIENWAKSINFSKKKEAFLAKKLKVEELQEKRYQAAYILDSLNALTPDNTYLTALEAEADQL